MIENNHTDNVNEHLGQIAEGVSHINKHLLLTLNSRVNDDVQKALCKCIESLAEWQEGLVHALRKALEEKE